jgi:transmembrane sensor
MEEIKIKELLAKFKDGNLSGFELNALYTYLKDNNPKMDQLFSEEWQSTPEGDADPELLEQFEILRNKFSLSSFEANKNRTSIRKILYATLKYAALIIIGFGIAWLTMYYKHIPIDKNIDQSFTVIKVEYGSKSVINLPDGSKVHLNSGSTLSYSRNFGANERKVKLEGEGFFEVKKDAKHPFYVETKQVTVKVLGTTFNVKSYLDEDITETTLITGKVEIYQTKSDKKTVRLAVLKPNQKAIVRHQNISIDLTTSDKKQDKVVPAETKVIVEKQVEPEKDIEWKNNILVFNNEPFSDIIKKMERWYGVSINLKNNKLQQIRFSGKFDRESVLEVLDALKLIQPFQYDTHKNQITIY